MDKSRIAEAVKGKKILVTGGTGSFGLEIVNELRNYDPTMIRILSRDEKKQYDMQMTLNDERLHFMIGDVRDYARSREAMRGMDIVYHAAALKQVPNCEYSPGEAVKTNIHGAENVRRAAIEESVSTVVAISTDKAVKPVNVMGMSKAIQERIMLQPTPIDIPTRFVCVRYGNVLGSRGSVVPLFHRMISDGDVLPITHPDMTRFQLTLNQSVQLVFWATANGESGDLWVRKMPSAKITDIGRVLAEGITGNKTYPQKIVGARPGEKMHEVLVSEEEMWRATEMDEYFLVPSWAKSHRRDKGPKEGAFEEYASNGVRMMTDDELRALLDSDGWFQEPTPKLPKRWQV